MNKINKMNKVVLVKAYFVPVGENKIVKVPTGEKKRGLLGGASDVMKDEKKWVQSGFSDRWVDTGRLEKDFQMADPEIVVQEFRQEYAKNFGVYHPRLTPLMVNTTYYMRLQRAGKPWNYIVGEFIRLNKFKLPRDQNSEDYKVTWRLYSKRLRKNIERSEKVLSALVGDMK